MTRCIFCGYCEVACPFDAITMGIDYELADYSRSDLIFTKEMLLAPHPERHAAAKGRASERATCGSPNSSALLPRRHRRASAARSAS